MPAIDPVTFRTHSVTRKLSWVAVALSVAGLAATMRDRYDGVVIPWTAWALPLNVIVVSSAFALDVFHKRPRFAAVLVLLTFVASVAVLAAIVRR